MKRTSKSVLILAVLLIVSVVVTACGTGTATEPAAAETVNLLMGSTSPTSGSYVPCVSLARITNKYVPDVQVTVVETGASVDNWVRMQKGNTDFGAFAGYEVSLAAYHGLGDFAENPAPWGRVGNIWAIGFYTVTVRADSDVYTLADLEGKKLHFGSPGSGGEKAGSTMFEAIGVSPDRVLGSLSDGVAMMKDNKVVGLVKYTPAGSLDSTLADIRATTPIRIISATEEEVAKTLQAYPGLVRMEIPAGALVGAEEQEEIVSGLGAVSGTIFPSEEQNPIFTQQFVYELTKTWDEHWDEMLASYPADKDFLTDLVKYTAGLEEIIGQESVPIHAGVVQYLKGKGVDVPDNLIPPEYQP